MIESVRQRQQNANDFNECYKNLCALQSSCPLGEVVANLGEDTIDFNADRISLQDWHPILNATKINKTLKVIALRSYWQEKLSNEKTDGLTATSRTLRKRAPAIRTRDVVYKVCRAIRDCISVTEKLVTLILQEIPLREKDLHCLSKGLSKNQTLSNLSFENCQIGDNGFEVVCTAIRDSLKLVSLNITGCCLTWRGAELLANLIKYQSTKKHSVAWQDSLRYRVPDLDRMCGMRRITACKNSLLGDRGSELLAEALKDDLWLKALDLQQCGISNQGALAFQSLLRSNKSLVVLDLRINPLIDKDLVCSITQHVLANSNGDSEYHWLDIVSSNEDKVKKLKSKKRRVHTVVSKASFSKVKKGSPVVRQGRPVSKSSRRNFVPWRTAARVGSNRHKTIKRAWPYLEKQKAAITVKDVICKKLSDDEERNETSEEDEEKSSSSNQTSLGELNDRIKELEIEVQYLNHRVQDESRSRIIESEKVVELQLENRRLKQEIDFLKAVGLSSSDIEKNRRAEQKTKRVLGIDFLDDNVLESIEKSFKQFHAFLDMLNGAELQDLQRLLDQIRSEKSASS